MKLKLIFPITFSALLSGFTAFSVLDTLVIESSETIDVVDDESVFEDSRFQDVKEEGEKDPEPVTPVVDDPVEEPTLVDPKTFSDDVRYGEDFYSSPEVYISFQTETIKTKHMTQNKMMNTIVYSADIKLKSLSHLRTAFAKDKFGKNIKELTSTIANRKEAVFAVNGDFYGAQEKGYVVRNGITYRETVNSLDREDLAIYYDGSFEIFKESETLLDDIVAKDAYQVFSFGPGLVKNGEIAVTEDQEVSVFSTLGNQRCSIGIIDSMHYFIMICDGRLKNSYGMSLYEAASYMKEKGCKTAYNLDGGGSATFWYHGKVLNRPNTNGDRDIEERSISDIVYIK